MERKSDLDLLDDMIDEDIEESSEARKDLKPSQFNAAVLRESSAKKVDDLFFIQLDELVPFQSKGSGDFSSWEDAEIDDMAKSMDKTGIYEPILVRQLENGKFEILSGEHRVKACRKKGLTKIKAVVFRGCTDEKAMDIFLLTNLQRRTMKISDQIYGWSLFAKTHPSIKSPNEIKETCEQVYEIKQLIGNEISINSSQYYRYIRMANLCPELIQALDKGKISLRVGYELSAYPKDEQILFMDYLPKLTEERMQLIREEVKRRNEPISEPLIAEIVTPQKPPRSYNSMLRSGMKAIRTKLEQRIRPEYYDQVADIMDAALEQYLSNHPEYKAEASPESGLDVAKKQDT